MKSIHVCLVSDQTIPNILAIETFRPDELLLVSTEKMEAQDKSRHILDCLAHRGLNFQNRHQVLKVVEDSLLDCQRKLESWITGRETSDFVVNLTGGTKIMSIAAYDFFKEYGCSMIYIPIARNEFIMPFPKRGVQPAQVLPPRLTVQQYLSAYGLRPLNTGHLDAMRQQAIQRRELAAWCVTHYEAIKALLIWFGHRLRPHRNRRQFVLEGEFTAPTSQEQVFLQRMAFSRTGHVISKTLDKSEIQFLTGGWLEEYCFNEICDFLGRGIDDAVLGIAIENTKGTQNEFDVLFTRDNALFTVECKSLDQKEDIKTEALYKVGALQKDFGLRAHSFFVSTAGHILNSKGALKPSIAARAQQFSTQVIAPHQVIDFKKHLARALKLDV